MDLLMWEAGALTPAFCVYNDQSPVGDSGIPIVVSLRECSFSPPLLPAPLTLGLSVPHSLQPRPHTMALAHLSSLPPGGRPSYPDPRVSDPAPALHMGPVGQRVTRWVKDTSLGVKPGSATSQGVNLGGSRHLSEPRFPFVNVGLSEMCVNHQGQGRARKRHTRSCYLQ